MEYGNGIHPCQQNTHPLATGVMFERFNLDSIAAQSTAWLKALKRGDPIMVNGRNITKEWETANTKLREHGGLCRDQQARERYGI